jgi:hypothetical protein
MIAEQIPAHARRIFAECPTEEQAMGSQLMMIGANPASREGSNGASTCVYSFSWPNFEPVRAQAHEVLSIGSGTGVAPYRQLLERHYSDPEWRVLLMHGESVPGGTASMLANSVTKVLQDNPQPGISAHLHLCVVRSGEVQIWTNDHSRKGRWQAFALGPPTINALPDTSDIERFSMPRVATTFSELNEMLSGNAALAVA